MLLLVACGGGGGKGSDGTSVDAPDNPVVDAPPTVDAPPAQMGIGQACTPVQGNPQADCPAGFECLNLTGAWCSRTCTAGMTDDCGTGYTGPGLARCVFQIMDGNTTRSFCGIICNDTTGACPATTCNDTCPAPLACSANLMNNMMMVVGKACF
jgi:hypothetical protein